MCGSSQSSTDFLQEVVGHFAKIPHLYGFPNVNKLIYTGDTSSMPGVIDELEAMIREKSLAVNQMFKFAGDVQGVEMNGLSSSVGACFAGLGIGTYKFNLLPHKGDYEIKKIAPLATKIFLVLVVLLTLGVFATDAVKQKKALQVMDNSLKKNEPVINEIKSMTEDISTLRKHSDLLHSIRSNEITLEVLTELANVLPKEAWVTNLNFKGFEIKSKKKDGGELIINGYADSSSSLIPLLEDSPLFEKVEFVGPIKKTKNKEQFKLSAKIIRPAVSGGKSK
jgi:Tfp pilus assembly protein PilN